jgi:hypothetical protein
MGSSSDSVKMVRGKGKGEKEDNKFNNGTPIGGHLGGRKGKIWKQSGTESIFASESASTQQGRKGRRSTHSAFVRTREKVGCIASTGVCFAGDWEENKGRKGILLGILGVRTNRFTPTSRLHIASQQSTVL